MYRAATAGIGGGGGGARNVWAYIWASGAVIRGVIPRLTVAIYRRCQCVRQRDSFPGGVRGIKRGPSFPL